MYRTLMALVLALLFFACSKDQINNPVIPSDDNPQDTVIVPPDDTTDVLVPVIGLKLIPLSTGTRSTSSLGDSPLIASDSGTTLIDFGDVTATRTLSFVLMNTGNVTLYDIVISGDSIDVWPSEIGLLEPTTGEISSLPLLDVTLPHVIPVSGVGAYLPMHLGEFSDTLSLQFIYDDTSGTPVTMSYSYPTIGNRVGGRIEVYSADGTNIRDAWIRSYTQSGYHALPYEFHRVDVPMGTIDEHYFTLFNTGNDTLPISIYDVYRDSVLIDTTLVPGDSLVAYPAYPDTLWIQHGSFYFWCGPTTHIVESLMGIDTDGFVGLGVGER